jgi:hypothetical protein
VPDDRHPESHEREQERREPGRVAGGAERRAGRDVVDAQRDRQAEPRELQVRVRSLGGDDRPDDEKDPVDAEPVHGDGSGGAVELVPQEVPDEESDHGRDAVPHAEDGGRDDRLTEGWLEPPEHERAAEVVEAQDEPDRQQSEH